MNLAYPKGLEKTFTFVQNILLGLRDNADANTISWFFYTLNIYAGVSHVSISSQFTLNARPNNLNKQHQQINLT
jgi:hypothetical protein